MKTAQARFTRRPAAAPQRGVVLIAALAVLLMLTLLSVSMFRSFGLEERITGNSREKAHAFYAAQTALQYAEQQLLSPTLGQPVTCGASISYVAGSLTVCDAATTPSQASEVSPTNITGQWAAVSGSTAYSLPSSFSTASTSAGTSTYLYAPPQYVVGYLGPDPSTPGGYLYSVTALGYGANAAASAVVTSVYSVVPAVTVNTNNGNY
jgi:type IV pilus assembly protein PilX